MRAVADRPEDLLDHAMEELAARAVRAPTERSAYHAITYGWLVAGLAQHVTGGRGLAELVRSEVAEPLGVTGLHIGVDETAREHVAQPVGSALRHLGAASRVITPALTTVKVTRGFHDADRARLPRALRGLRAVDLGHRDAGRQRRAERGLARAAHGALANGGAEPGGPRLLSEAAVHDLGRVHVRTNDAVLGLKMRWRLGYHHAFGTGRSARMAFGHYGYGGSGGWADPDLSLSLGFVTNRIGSITTPMADATLYG